MRIAYNPKSEAPLTAAPTGKYLNAITFDLAGHNIFTRGEMFKGTDTTYEVFRKATQSAVGYNGLVPAPSYNSGSIVRFLREDGNWVEPINTYRPVSINDTTILDSTNTKALNLKSNGAIVLNPLMDSNSKYTGEVVIFANEVTQSQSGFMSAADKIKLDNMTFTPGDGFSGTLADAFTTIKVGGQSITAVAGKQTVTFTPGTGIQLQLDTTNYNMIISGNIMTGATSENSGTLGFVPAPEVGKQIAYLRGDGIWKVLTTDQILRLEGYSKHTELENLEVEDTLNIALGKLEYKADLGVTAYDIISAAHDGDGTIENLNEILKVLEGISDTDTIKEIIGKYLPLTGGTLVGPLAIDVSNTEALQFNRDSNKLSLGISGIGEGWLKSTFVSGNSVALILNEDRGLVYKDTYNNYFDILHSGNYNMYLPKYDGVNMTKDTTLYKTSGVINNQPIDFVTSSDSVGFTIYAPNELGQENYILQSTGTGLTWVDPLTLGGGGSPAVEFIKQLTVTSTWSDVEISGNTLETGTYIIQVTVNVNNMSECIWSGVMSWYSGTCADNETDEILLHRSGKAYSDTIYLRTVMQTDGPLKLQIAADDNISAQNYTFKFKRMI